MKKRNYVILVILALCIMLPGCGNKAEEKNIPDAPALEPLPLPEVDTSTEFGTDIRINQETIDDWLDRDDVVYRDVRMLYDPAEYSAIGGEADLTATIRGFKIVPYPYIATLQSLPVANAYTGDKLFDVEWTDDGHVVYAKPLYEESMMILEELFPKDKAVFLMCGGGGYANMTKQLLLYLGWDGSKLYNIGANWTYKGNNAEELVVYPESKDGNLIYAAWRADYAYIPFDKLNKLQ